MRETQKATLEQVQKMTQEEFDASIKLQGEVLEEAKEAIEYAKENGGTVFFDIGDKEFALDVLYDIFEDSPFIRTNIFCCYPEESGLDPVFWGAEDVLTRKEIHSLMSGGTLEDCTVIGDTFKTEEGTDEASVVWHRKYPGGLFFTVYGKRPYNEVEEKIAELLYNSL